VTSINLRIPEEQALKFGLCPDSDAEAVAGPDGLLLPRSVNQLTKVYVEVTAACNLSCRTCVRNAWDEPLGTMSLELFDRLLEQLRAFPKPLTMFFGGFGEPLVHANLPEMMRRARDLGARVELITNGTLLSSTVIRTLVDLAVDRVWISIDGLTPGSYAAIRRGGQFQDVQRNAHALYVARLLAGGRAPDLGLAFVAMKSNVAQLPDLYRLASGVHASEIMVSNLLPHTQDMVEEILYQRTVSMSPRGANIWPPLVRLPRLDVDDTTTQPLVALLRSARDLHLLNRGPDNSRDRCPFVSAGSTAVRWDGQVSPCPPLLHSHPEFVLDRWRQVSHASFGSIAERSLAEIWHSAEYAAFRRRVRAFDFSPCVYCGGCEYSEDNEEDCFGNIFPTCGGCLWAQGVIQCP
jgi:MoaA/NifB/PqqE/SkfB family radical SAM enzyme